nr:reverse transcriptase domain-containing protein [Tanacetum cinerariifolium]
MTINAADHWSTMVNHRSTTADHGGDWRSTVALNNGLQWRTTVDCRWTTIDHHRTTGQRWLVNSQHWTWARTGGAVALTRWIEKMESVIDNSGCLANQRVKYVASSFIDKALNWDDFKALLTTEFCPSNEIEKLE